MKLTAKLCMSSALLLVINLCAYAQQKPCLTASKFGPDDQVGNLNYVACQDAGSD